MHKNLFLAAILLLTLTGCAGSRIYRTAAYPNQLSSQGHRVCYNMKATNSGMFLFYWIPLWSGSVSHSNRKITSTCRNYIKPKYGHIMLESRLKRLKADAIEDVKVTTAASGWLGLGILWHRTLEATGVAVKY